MKESTRKRLVDEAMEYGTFREFTNAVGWEDWMAELCDKRGLDYISEADNVRIDYELLKIWEEREVA